MRIAQETLEHIDVRRYMIAQRSPLQRLTANGFKICTNRLPAVANNSFSGDASFIFWIAVFYFLDRFLFRYQTPTRCH